MYEKEDIVRCIAVARTAANASFCPMESHCLWVCVGGQKNIDVQIQLYAGCRRAVGPAAGPGDPTLLFSVHIGIKPMQQFGRFALRKTP